MDKKHLIIVLLTLFALSNKVACQNQYKTVAEGCMSLVIPSDYKIEKTSGSIASSIQVSSDGAIYMFVELNSDFNADYVMLNSILNNSALSEANWGAVEDCTFLSLEAKVVDFDIIIDNNTFYGSAVAFNGGNGKAYGIIVLKTEKHSVLNDQIAISLKLSRTYLSSTEKYTTTRDEVKSFINELKPQFGSPIALGVTIENIELDSRKDIVTFTFRILLITKTDIDEMSPLDRDEFIAEMKSGAVESVKNMKAFSAMKCCMDEGYTFIINYQGQDKKQLFSFTLKPNDYK